MSSVSGRRKTAGWTKMDGKENAGKRKARPQQLQLQLQQPQADDGKDASQTVHGAPACCCEDSGKAEIYHSQEEQVLATTHILSVNSFIHSFILVISIALLEVLYTSEALQTTARSLTPKRTGNSSKGLAQGPYVAARAGVEPTTLR